MKNLSIITTFIFFSLTNLNGQTFCDSLEIFVVSEVMPKPSITYSQLEEILNNSISLNGILLPKNGIIILSINLNCKGEVINYRSLYELDSELKDKIIQTIKSSIHWTPAKQANKNVDFWIIMKIIVDNGEFNILDDKEFNKRRKS